MHKTYLKLKMIFTGWVAYIATDPETQAIKESGVCTVLWIGVLQGQYYAPYISHRSAVMRFCGIQVNLWLSWFTDTNKKYYHISEKQVMEWVIKFNSNNKSCHDANFIVTGGTEPQFESKVGTMATLRYHWLISIGVPKVVAFETKQKSLCQ